MAEIEGKEERADENVREVQGGEGRGEKTVVRERTDD